MLKKQQLIALGGLTSLFSRSGINKQPPKQGTSGAAVLPCHDSAWQWASCGLLHPTTLSFRQQQQQEEDADHGYGRQHHDNDDNHTAAATMMNSASAAYYSTDSLLASVDYSFSTAEAAEAVVTRAVRSDRLLFEPEEGASSLTLRAAGSKPNKRLIIKTEDSDGKDTTTSKQAAAFGGAMAMSVESENPYHDFRESMEAMVMSQLQGAVSRVDWRWMEEMLGWYLRANGKSTHGLIVNAFVDLLLALSTTPADDSSSPATTPVDSSSSPATPAATTAGARRHPAIALALAPPPCSLATLVIE